MLAADLVFLIAVGFVIACNLYFEPRIKSDRIAMQWGLDGKPTWSAPKRWALWGMVAFMVAVRVFIWASMTYSPEKVHSPELGVLLFSIIFPLSHVYLISKAAKSNYWPWPKSSRSTGDNMPVNTEAERVWRDRIRDVLNQEWDPIGGCPPDEYDMYIDEIASMLRFDKTDDNLLKYLEWAVAVNMGIGPANAEHDRKVVKSLRKLSVPNEA